MTSQNTPDNGDFASLLAGKVKNVQPPATERPTEALPGQTIEDVLQYGEEPTDEFLQEWNELKNLPELSEEELAQQALNAPGADGDINTPE